MNKNVAKIINDLYQIEPDLKPFESELEKIIEELLISKPDTKFDKQFALKLRSQLAERAAAIKAEAGEGHSQTSPFRMMFPAKFAYALGGALITVIIVIPIITFFNQEKKTAELPSETADLFSQGMTKLAAGAFGSLSEVAGGGASDQAVSPGSGLESNRQSVAYGLGGGGGTASTPAPAEGKAAIMPPMNLVEYKYVYQGDEIILPDSQLDVFKRVKSESGANALANYVANLNLGLVDLSQFKDLKLTNMSISEDRDFGYMLYLNMQENTLDIWANWEKWPQPAANCRDQACFDSQRLSISDVPDDATLISIARKFLNDYKIDISHYGEPVVQNNWRRQYEVMENKADYYIPDEMSVIFPELVNGEEVYDTTGYPSGLYVGVNIRQKRASNVHSIMPNNYESSQYSAVADSRKIVEVAEKGGMYPDYLYGQADKVVEVNLGTPTLGLIKYWKYDAVKGTGWELLVPAYIFPITNLDEIGQDSPYYYRENIVVPLIQEILDSIETPTPIEPMPLIKGGAVEPAPAVLPAVDSSQSAPAVLPEAGAMDSSAVMPEEENQ